MRLRRSAFLLAILLQSCPFLTNCRYHKSKITGSDERHKNNEETRGLVVCAGEGDSFLEMISMIEQTRYRLESVLPIVVAHCNELSDESISIILSVSDVQVLNICTTANPVIASMSRRMSGFFCKPAALILSPFRHTIVADTDDVFFKKPELLFDSPQYLATGTLFFRDRWTQTRAKNSLTQGEGTAKFVFKYLEYGENFLKEWSKNSPAHREFPNYREERILNKMNLALSNSYFRHFANGSGFTPDHWQDSSVVLFDSQRHPRSLALMRHVLPNFNHGYGDKEMYWMTVTAAGEPFAFESHVAGSLGDCGALLHYDPRYSNPSENLNGVNYRGTETNQSSTIDASVKVNDEPTHSTEAFYINAEYLVDSKKLKKVGDFLDSSNILLTKPLPVNEKYSPIFMLNKWVNTDHGFYPCGQCTHAVCQQLDNSSIIIQEIKVRQKILLHLRSEYSKAKATATVITLSAYKNIRLEIENDLKPEVQTS